MFNMLQLYTKYANKSKSKPNLKSSHFYSLHWQKNTNFFTKMYLKNITEMKYRKILFRPYIVFKKKKGLMLMFHLLDDDMFSFKILL